MITSESYQRNISDIARFLTTYEDGGFLFAVVKHQGIIPEINDTLRRLGKNSNKKIKLFHATLPIENDLTYIGQVNRAAEKADALIFNNLDEFIVSKPEEYLLIKLNFSRETLYALRTPMLFWVHEHNLQSIHNHFADVYSQRAFANIYFDDIPETDAGDELDQYFGEEYLNTEEYKRVQLRINLLTNQLEDAEKTNYPPLRIANDIAISLIEAYANIQVYEPAYDLLKKYKTYFKNTLSNLLIQGELNHRINNLDEAFVIYKQAMDIYGDATARNATAHILLLRKNYDEARSIYEQTVKQFPNNAVARNGLAEILKQQGDYKAARDIYKQTVKQFPNDVFAKNGLANILQKMGDYTQAKSLYQQTANRFPDDAVARTGLAEGLKKQEDYKGAEEIYVQIVEQFPKDVFARNGLADTLKKQGDYTAAKRMYRQTIEQFSNDVVARNGLAEVLKQQGDYTAAINMYEQTSEIFPNDIFAKTGLADILIELKKYDEALKLFEEVLSINPKNKYAKNGKAKALKLIQKRDQSTQA